MEVGKIVLKNDNWIILVDHGSFNDNYWPVNLPEKYMINGQEIVFEGSLGRIPLNVKLPGTPIELSMIRNLYRTKPNNINGEKQVTETNSNNDPMYDSVGYINNETGKIIKISDTYLIEQTIKGEINRYVPDFLPEDFRIENASITFSGTIGKIPANVRMMGTPLKIKEIMLVENIKYDISEIQDPMKEYFPLDSVAYLPSTKGTIKLIGSEPGVYIIEVDNGRNSITRYLPALLPDEFKTDGLLVIISGNIGKIPANVRMVGTPFEIKEIKLDK